MKTKRMFWALFIETLIISILAVGMQPVQAQGAGTLALSPETIYVESGSEPAGWPYFDVNVTITNVTNIIGAVFSIHWDPTILNLTDVVGVPPFVIPGYPDYLLPTGAGGISGLMKTINYTEGNLKQAAQVQLAPFSPKTYTAPNWGWVAELTFEFIGTPPPVGSTINTNITIVDDPGALMATEWTPNGIVWNKFETLGTCEFTYVGPGVHDVAVTYVVPSTFVVLVGESVEINVTVENEGDFEESFNLKLYAGVDLVENKTALNLAAGANQTYAFNWATTAIGNFTIKAEVPQVPGEVDTTDNTWTTTVWRIRVIPEFPSFTLLPLLIIATVAAAILAKTAWSNKRRRL